MALTEEYYKKFIELQENLRKSEEERLRLEMKFNEMVRITREETQMHYRKLRAQYKKFLDEDRKRQDRNERILRNLESIEARLAMITAKTERFKLLRQQYRAMLDRLYKTKLNQQKTDQDYAKSTVTQQVDDLSTKNSYNFNRNDHFSTLIDDEYRPNFANSLADDIIRSIDKKCNYRIPSNDRQFEKKPELNIGNLPGNSIGSSSVMADDELAENFDNDLEKLTMGELPKVERILDKFDDVGENQVHDTMESSDSVNHEFGAVPTEQINNQPTHGDYVRIDENNRNDRTIEEIPEENQKNVIEVAEVDDKEILSPTKIQLEPLESDGNIPETDLNPPGEHPIEKQNTEEVAGFSAVDHQNINDETITAKLQVDKEEEKEPDSDVKAPPADVQLHPEYPDSDITTDNEKNIEFESAGKNPIIEEQSSINDQLYPVYTGTDQGDVPDIPEPMNEEQNTINNQLYAEYPNSETQYDDENAQFMPQYDEHGQLIPQYDQNGLLIPQYDENGQLIPQYDQYGQVIPQYDQNGQVIPQYDENGRVIPQYDENGQVIPQYDENGQMIQHYDENGQAILQYDENGQAIGQYYTDPNQEYGGHQENYPDSQQHVTNPESVHDENMDDARGKDEEIEEATNIGQNNEEARLDENKEITSKSNVLEMLDTDTETSMKQDTKVSNDSDFDFSNS